MKKILYFGLALLTGIIVTACSNTADDYDLEDVKLQDMCGTWMCTVEANDAYYTDMYYIVAGGYTADFLNGYFGDPYGYYNPDANGDGIVDLKDLQSDEYAEYWYDESGNGAQEFHTANTAANNLTEMWVKDPNWNIQYKVTVDANAKTFGTATTVATGANTVVIGAEDAKATLNSLTSEAIGIPDNCKVVVLDGKILKNAAHAPGSGMVCDSIIFYVKYDNDYAEDMYYKVSGYRKTGYTEDD